MKLPENGRKNIFTDKQTTNKIPLMLLDINVLMESQILHFSTAPTNKQGAVHVFSLWAIQKVNSGQKAEQKVRIMFFENKVQQDRFRSCNY